MVAASQEARGPMVALGFVAKQAGHTARALLTLREFTHFEKRQSYVVSSTLAT
jgi:hypothetical protein